ncbi:hypothetical protein PAXRUDRAFT_18708 [Paxillus rubicundulus Ve08.2h10]|uniref:WD40 repeat-like protein n=1 Tax=Paxillus rubicundulus Ve08.2h10 TaxID=930991 RepID=A0A0D0BWV8_9AGAM|nr:hypothetical protein PAXRUDRAFT_18708 [Paxillus rubicundulus Ve08.2h10]
MHVLEGHEDRARSVRFSWDSRRVASGSDDATIRVWLVDSGGDRIASAASSVQIWDAETGFGILSIRNSLATSLAWTADGTCIIGGGYGEVTAWNSHNGEQLHTWKTHSNTLISLSLSPAGTRLATCDRFDKTAFVFDVSTGEQIEILKHDQDAQGITYSPSGQFIATVCADRKVYLWRASQTESHASSLLSFLDQSAVLLAEPPRNDRAAPDQFWESPTNRDQSAPQPPQRIFNKVKYKLANFFARRPAGIAQTSPVRETVEPVEVAAGRDKTFWVVLERIVWTPMNTMMFMIFYCRRPDPQERGGFLPTNRDTRVNSSRAPGGNPTATSNCSEPQNLVDSTGNAGARPDAPPTPAGNPVIRAQPKPTVGMSLCSAENPGAEPHSSAAAAGNSQMCDQSGSIEMVTIRAVSTRVPPQRIPSTDPSVTLPERSSSTAVTTTAPLSMAFNSASPAFAQPSLPHLDIRSGNTFSTEEIAIIKDLRRRKMLETII